MKSWVEISKKRLAGNYGVLTRAVGADVSVMGAVKADAYGHGIALCAPVLARAGAEWLGVADAAEGATVRAALLAAGIEQARQPRVMTMSGMLDGDSGAIVAHELTPVVWNLRQMELLAAEVKRCGRAVLPVHLEIDSGMTRQGIRGEGLPEALRWLASQKELLLDGVMTHFASAEVAGSEQTRQQRAQFAAAVQAARSAGLRPKWVHAGASSTVDNDLAEASLCWLHDVAAGAGARAMVRTGIALYGYCLPLEGAGARARVGEALRPVMTWKTRVIDLRTIAAGDAVGYNGTFVAKQPMRVALLPVGYSDGLRRSLSSTNARAGGWVMVRGQRAAIIGRVSMNLTVVDVTGIAEAAVGDEVVMLGDGATADDHARLAETISYEILCGVRAGSRRAV